jgi:hypothetical protein
VNHERIKIAVALVLPALRLRGQWPADLPKNKELLSYLVGQGFAVGVIGDALFLRDIFNKIGRATDPSNQLFAHFSDRGRRFKAIVDAQGMGASEFVLCIAVELSGVHSTNPWCYGAPDHWLLLADSGLPFRP